MAINVTAGPITGTANYTLDALYRLTAVDAQGTANDEAFSYDHIGNRLIATRGSATVGASGTGITSKYWIYNPATQTGTVTGYSPSYNNRLKEIRLASVSGSIDSSFTFDNEGRLVSQTGSTPRTLTWDAKSRLNTLLQGGTKEAYAYAYDPTNHRIRRTGGSVGNLDYYLEGDHLESVEQSGALVEKYFRGSTIDELVAGYTNQAGTLTPFMFQHDSVMSVVAETKPNGGTQAALTYFAFGEAQATTGTAISRLQFTGRENDGNGCYQYRARTYCPAIGQFISEDPKKFEAGQSFYAYVGNNPTIANDPMGLDTKITIGYTQVIPGEYHKFVILTDTVTGKQFATRAGPSAQGVLGSAMAGAGSSAGGSLLATITGDGSSGGYGFGQITAVASPYDSSFRDAPNLVARQEVGTISRDYSTTVRNAIEFANTTNNNAIPYWPSGPNSNSYATTFVQSITGTRPPSVLDAPGSYVGTPSSNLSYKPASITSNIGGSFGSLDPNAPGGWDSAAAGGFLLYPNKPNNNGMQAAYSK
jgi:RHS repeat-associated protein